VVSAQSALDGHLPHLHTPNPVFPLILTASQNFSTKRSQTSQNQGFGQGKRMRIVTCCYGLIDKFHVQNTILVNVETGATLFGD
jgi:hypothetical protein